MRQIDFLLLEDTMMRRNVATDARARAAQTASMLLVLMLVVGMFVHAVAHGTAVSVASTPTGMQQPHAMSGMP